MARWRLRYNKNLPMRKHHSYLTFIFLLTYLMMMINCSPKNVSNDQPIPVQPSIPWTPDRLGKPNTIATMEDFWQGKARWQLDRVWTPANTGGEYGFNAGSRIAIVKGTWYLFYRKIYKDKCPGTPWEKLGTVVRRSMDKGITWSDPVDVVIPTSGTPWSCMGTDGDIFYNAQENKWQTPLYWQPGPPFGVISCHPPA